MRQIMTAIAAGNFQSRPWLFVYSGLLGVFVLHAATHVFQVVIFGGYIPGLITALTVIPAVGSATYRRFDHRIIDAAAAVTTSVVAAVAFVPLFGSSSSSPSASIGVSSGLTTGRPTYSVPSPTTPHC